MEDHFYAMHGNNPPAKNTNGFRTFFKREKKKETNERNRAEKVKIRKQKKWHKTIKPYQ